MTSDRDPVVACAEHRELCDAIFAGDADFTAATAYAHIERGRGPTLETLKAVLPPSLQVRGELGHDVRRWL